MPQDIKCRALWPTFMSLLFPVVAFPRDEGLFEIGFELQASSVREVPAQQSQHPAGHDDLPTANNWCVHVATVSMPRRRRMESQSYATWARAPPTQSRAAIGLRPLHTSCLRGSLACGSPKGPLRCHIGRARMARVASERGRQQRQDGVHMGACSVRCAEYRRCYDTLRCPPTPCPQRFGHPPSSRSQLPPRAQCPTFGRPSAHP